MKHILTILTVFFMAFATTGCSTVTVDDYKNTTPILNIEDYFVGNTKAHGVFQDRFGKVRRTFVVDIKGDWNKKTNTLNLVEDFIYNDGETEQRVWTIVKANDGSYKGTAKNVVGDAIGVANGNAFNFKYTFDLAVEDSVWRVKFDDWMYLLDDKTLFNKATITRYGIRLGDVYIYFTKP
jgi:hypothetical protein